MRFCKKCEKEYGGEGRICRQCGGILEDIPDAELVGRSRATNGAATPNRGPVMVKPAKTVRHRPPLGLPSGSIRALLTLMIVAVVVVRMARGGEVEVLWTETLMIALAHYFTSRRLIQLSPELRRQVEAEQANEPEAHPLFLPRHSIRAIIILAFVGLAVYLLLQERLLEPQPLSLLGVVFTYFLGIMARNKSPHGWEDAKAAVVLGVLAYAAGANILDRPDLFPTWLRSVTLALVLFYFGSR